MVLIFSKMLSTIVMIVVSNYKKRFEMIIDEVLRLNTKKQEIISFFKNNKIRFDKNIEIFNEIKKDKSRF